MTPLDANQHRALLQTIARLETRLAALEAHITEYGPKVVKVDYETPGSARWEEPYRPPETETA